MTDPMGTGFPPQTLSLMRRHAAVVILALAVGTVSVFPQVFFALTAPEYAGVSMFGSDGEESYLARIQEVSDGYPRLGNVFLPEKDQPALILGLGEIISAWIGKSLGLGTAEFNIFAKFLFPFAITLCFYALALGLFSSRFAALLGAAIAMLGYNLTGGLSHILGLLTFETPITEFLLYSRPINPEISSLFLMGVLGLFVWNFLRRSEPSSWMTAALGVGAGLTIYLSIFAWSFLFALFGLYFVWSVAQRSYGRGRHIVGIACLGLLASLPFWYNYADLVTHPNYLETALRIGLVEGRAPVVSVWVLIMLGLALFAWPRKHHNSRPFFIIAALALLALSNQQVITGMLLQVSHYHWYITLPLVSLILGMYATAILDMLPVARPYRPPLLIVALLVLLHNAAIVQVNSYVAQYPRAVMSQSYAPVLDYLRALPAAESIFTDPNLSLYIPVYTRHDAPNNEYAPLYLGSDDYFITRLLLSYKLAGVHPDRILERMKSERAGIAQRVYIIYYREKFGSYASIPDEILEDMAIRYTDVWRIPYADIFERLGVTAVIWDKGAFPSAPYESISSLTPLADIGERFTLYRVSS